MVYGTIRKLISIILILRICLGAMVIPDKSFPMMLNKPSMGKTGHELVLRFSLDSDSKGLLYKQFIGVAFPRSDGDKDIFGDSYDYSTEVKKDRFRCMMKDLTENREILVSSQPSHNEANVLYCRLDDLIIELKAKNSYMLTITLDYVEFTSQFYKSIGVFTATSNSPDKMILDSAPVYGSLGLYRSLSSTLPPPLAISSVILNNKANKDPKDVYPYQTFDISIKIKVNGYVSKDNLFIIRYPNDMVNSGSKITTEAVNSKIDAQMELKGTLGLVSFTSDSVQITGIAEDLFSGREFQITLKEWKSRDTNIGNKGSIELWVYYPNTYSIVSYSSNSDAIIIKKNPITLTVANPDDYYLIQNGGWPLKFTIQTSSDIPDGGYVVIQQTNANDSKSLWAFSSSTCDFTANDQTVVNQKPGERPVCGPLINDFNYPGRSSSADYAGSGILFKLPKISATSTYTLTVWGLAVKCGKEVLLPDDPFIEINADYYTDFEFNVKIYKSFDVNKDGLERLTQPGNQVLAESLNIKSLNRCYSSDIINRIELGAEKNTNLHFFREFNNFDLVNSVCANPNVCFTKDITAFPPNPIYLNSSTMTKNNYFLLKADFSLSKDQRIYKELPLNFVDIANGKITSTSTSGKLDIRISKGWIGEGVYKAGEQNCMASWAISLKDSNGYVEPTVGDAFYELNPATPEIEKNILITDKNTEIAESRLTLNTSGSFRIVGKYSDRETPDNSYQTSIHAKTACEEAPCEGQFALYTNCVTLNSGPSVIKSSLAYIDIIYSFLYMNTLDSTPVPQRTIRMIKMFPEFGVWNDPIKHAVNTTPVFALHLLNGASADTNGICILELFGDNLSKLIDTNKEKNTMQIYLFNLSLLDTDYTDASSTYPVITSTNLNISANGLNNSMILDDLDSSISLKAEVDKKFFPKKTNYLFYMSSLVTVSNLQGFVSFFKANNARNSMLIPTMCPLGVPDTSSKFTSPVVTINMMNIDENGLYSKDLIVMGKVNGTKIQFNNIYETLPVISSQNPVTLKFNRYSSDSPSDRLNVFLGNIGNEVTSNTDCTAFTFLLNSSINVLPDNLKLTLNPVTSLTPYYFLAKNKIYLKGVEFSQFIIALPQEKFKVVTGGKTLGKDESADVHLSGVLRPADEFFDAKSGKFKPQNKIAFYCTNSASLAEAGLTNYVYDVTRFSSVKAFILDYNQDMNLITKVEFKNDAEVIYPGDVGSNFSFEVQTSLVIGRGSILKFRNSQIFNPSTNCGIVSGSGKATNCVSSIYTSWECPINQNSDRITICCSNVNIKDSLQFESLTIKFPNEDIKNLESYLTSDQIVSRPEKIFWDLTKANLLSRSSITSAKIANFKYNYVNQDKGIGKVTFDLNLPRQLTRNTKITISGNFYLLAIPDVVANCKVEASSTNGVESGDSIISSCSARNLIKTKDSIVIHTKNEIYKCGLSFTKVLKISIWPIITHNMKVDDSIIYTVNIVSNTTGEELAPRDVHSNLPFQIFDKNLKLDSPLVSGRWNNLCIIKNIFPRIVEESAYYDIEFDLFSFRHQMSSHMVNEFTVFLPVSHYGPIFNNLQCSLITNTNIGVNCYNDMEGAITIRLSSGITVSDVNPVIRIVGITNPGIEEISLRFPCTVNYFDNQSVRTNLLTGGAMLFGGISIPPRGTRNLLVMSTRNMLSDPNPRSLGTINLKVSFDRSSNSVPSNISYPIVIITFPNEYRFNNFKKISILVSMEEWVINSSNQFVESASNVPITSVNVLNNSIYLQMDYTKSFDSFGFWNIKLENVPAPFDVTNTSGIRVSITNKQMSVLFKSFTNLSSLNGNMLDKPIDQLLTAHKGLSYDFDKSKFIIDVSSPNMLEKNEITITPGVYKEYMFVVRPDTMMLPSGSTNIILNDDVFKLGSHSYNLVSSSGKISFLIGASCDTAKGEYYIAFSVSNTKNFVVIPPIKVTVGEIQPAEINVTHNTNIPAGSSTNIYYTLEKLNFDPLSITWINGPNNDSSANVFTVVIPPLSRTSSSLFQIMNDKQTTTQTFTVNNPNKCFDLQMKSTMINLNTVSFPVLSSNTLTVEEWKKRFDFTTDTVIEKLELNMIRVKFTSPISPINLACAIQCMTSDFPSNFEILNSSDKSGFFTHISIEKTNQLVNIDFNNLMRGQSYKMRCIIQTTESMKSSRQQIVLDFADGLSSKLTTVQQEPTRCMRLSFTKDPGSIMRQSILNYCQSNLSFKGGCITCMDNTGMILKGLELNTFTGCILNNDKKSIFYNEINMSNPFGDPSAQGNAYIYTVCAVQDNYCSNNVSNNEYKLIIETLIENLSTVEKFSSNLKLPTPPIIQIDQVVDSAAPSLNNVRLLKFEVNENGFYSVTLTNPQPIYCSWLISPSSITSYTFDNVYQCRDTSRCGKVKVNSKEKTFIADNSNIQVFVPGPYSLWMACYNDYPSPIQKSEPKVVKEFRVDSAAFAFVSHGNIISSSYMLLMLFALILLV